MLYLRLCEIINHQKILDYTYVFSTGCSLNIVFFPKNVVIFLNSASFAAALVFYLPSVCTHTDTKGKQRKVRVWNILKS